MSAQRYAPGLFVLLTLVFGGYLWWTVPPFQGPDETAHLYRAYAISTGELEPLTEGAHPRRRGGMVPVSLTVMLDSFDRLRWNAAVQTRRSTVAHFATVPLKAEQQVFVDYPNTAIFPFVTYLPAAAGLWVARHLNTSALTALRLARAAGLCCWLLCGSLALWLLPGGLRTLFLALLTLPMTVFTHAVVSGDTFTNSVAILTLAYLLRWGLRQDEAWFGGRQLATLCGLTVVLVSAKIVYVPLLLLAFLIPRRRFTTPGGRWGPALLVGGLAVTGVMVWSARAEAVYLPRPKYDPSIQHGLQLPPGASIPGQRRELLRVPARIHKAVRNSAVDAFPMYSRGYIGTFGWLDHSLPDRAIVLAYVWLLVLTFFGGDRRTQFAWRTRALLALTFLLTHTAMIVSQLVSWEPVGSATVGTVQGRYLMPYAPLMFLLGYRGVRPRAWIFWMAAMGSVALLTLSALVIHQRYYLP